MIVRLTMLLAAGLVTGPGGTLLPLADIPDVSVVPYDVVGRNPAEVRRSIDAARPTDPNDGKRVDGLSRWDFRWRWHRDAEGTCGTTADDLRFSATVRVPRLADPKAPARLRDRFDRYLRSLLAHEDGHVRYAWEHRGDIVAAINAATCETAGAAAQEAVRTIAAHDIAYDKATGHGATTVVRLD